MKVGDYVRTKDGYIGKIIDFIDEPTDYYLNCYETDLKTSFIDKYITEDTDIKSSPNIIDLIEVGDYVNGYEITSIQEIEEPYYLKRLAFSIIDGGENNICAQVFNDKDIKSIVTKECFESMEYKVGE